MSIWRIPLVAKLSPEWKIWAYLDLLAVNAWYSDGLFKTTKIFYSSTGLGVNDGVAVWVGVLVGVWVAVVVVVNVGVGVWVGQ